MWCHAIGNAHHASEPNRDWPAASGKMFRSRANIHAMAIPATSVSGTRTGLGQCRTLKIVPAMRLASQGRLTSDKRRLVSREFRRSAGPGRTRNTSTAGQTSGSSAADAEAALAAPITNNAIANAPLTTTACFVAGHKLSARMPSVFGVSRWIRSSRQSTRRPTPTHVGQ